MSIQDAWIRVTTIPKLGRYPQKTDDYMTADDWNTQFVITPSGYLTLHSSKIKRLRLKHKIMLILDEMDDCLWNVWTLVLPYVEKGLTPHQAIESQNMGSRSYIGASRFMRGITFLLRVGYIVRP